MKQKDAAEHVLKKKGRPMHVKDIARQAEDDGLIESDNPNLKGAFAVSIRTDIKNLGNESRFVKVEWAGSTFGLREWPDKLLDDGAHATRKSSDGAGRRPRGHMTYIEAALEILSDEGGPLHKDEIAKRAKESGLIKKTDNKRIGDFIAAMISTEIRKMGAKSRFSKEKTVDVWPERGRTGRRRTFGDAHRRRTEPGDPPRTGRAAAGTQGTRLYGSSRRA